MLKISCIAVLCCVLAVAAAPAGKSAAPTYSKDVALILNERCVACHRTGEVGPMPLTSFKEVRPFAKAIREAVAEGKMPPWHADPHVGKFSNERRLTEAQIRTLLEWVNNGAPEGDAKDLPPAPKFTPGWTIGKPDLEITIPQPFEVPAEGVVDYQYMITATNLTEDKWVAAAEVRPGNRSVVHHVIAFVLPPAGEQPQARPAGAPPPTPLGKACEQARPTEEQLKFEQERRQSGRLPREDGPFLIGWAPGMQGSILPPGSGRLIRAGSRIKFQLHYTPSGKMEVDRDTKIGLIFARGPVTTNYYTLSISNRRIVLPPGEANYEAASCYTFNKDVTLVEFMPHMHLRGKDFIYRVTYPDGRTETVLSVPKYDFGWQTQYRLAEALKLPKGTRIDCTAHFDNSARNKNNPDPTKEVRWGDQTWEEMMIGWIDIAVDREPPPPAPAARASN